MKKECIESVGAVERILLKKSKGITLISLVITIVLLLILAGISIQAMTSTGLFEAAGRAKKEDKRAQVIEWLNLKLIEQQSENTKGTAEDIIKATQESVKNNISELETIGKDIVVENTKTEEDGEKADIYFYVQVDKDVYKVELKGAKFIGEAGKFPPIINIESVTSTTNSITVKVSTKRNEGGELKFYIKDENEEKYKDIEKIKTEKNADNLEFTYTGLEQNKKYSIKIVAIAENKQTTEVIRKDIQVGNVPELTTQNVEFTYSPSSWTNENVKVTAELKDMTSSYTLKITDSNPVGASKTIALGWKNAREGITVDSNKQVYALLIDSEGQIGGAATGKITNIDKEPPKVFNIETTSTIDTITVKASTTDKEETTSSGKSGMEGYRFSKDRGKTWTEYQTSGTYIFENMLKNIEGDTYDIQVQAKDKAQNVTTSSIQASTIRNSNYYIEGAGKLLLTIGNNENYRKFYKYSNKGAIAGLVFAYGKGDVGGGNFQALPWIYPLMVSTDYDAVTFYCVNSDGSESGNLGSYGSVSYKGNTYYYSSDAWWIPGVNEYHTEITPLNSLDSQYKEEYVEDTLKKAAIDLIKKYFGE